MRESKYVQMPFYVLLSIIFSLAVWSLVPHLFGDADSASAASFASATTVSSSIAKQGKTRLLSVDGTYYLAFSTTSTVSTSEKAVYITTSTNGVSWSVPVLGMDRLGVISGSPIVREASEFGFVYNTVSREFAISGLSNTAAANVDVIFTTSSNAFTWSATTTIVSDTGGGFTNPNPKTPLSFSTTTGMYAMGFFTGPNFFMATSSNGVTWNSTSIAVADSAANISNEWLADVLAVSVSGTNIYAVYDNMVSGSSRFYEILFASSTNGGNTWATTSITGHLNTAGTSPFSMRDATRAAINYDGKASVMYYDLTLYDSSQGGAITGTIGYAHRSNTSSAWTTSTYDSNHMINSMLGTSRFNATDILNYASDRAILVYYSNAASQGGTQGIEYAAQVTSSDFIDTGSVVTFSGQPSMDPTSRLSLAYTTSTQVVAVAYIQGTTLKFTTSSLRSVDFNGVPTSTPNLYPAASTTEADAGLVRVTTTISDSDGDAVNLTVEYSVNGGESWSSATISTATLATGVPSIPTTGRIAGLGSTSGAGNVLTFIWNSATDKPSMTTTSAQVRIRPEDAYGNGLYLASSNFEIDNLPPSSTTFVSATFAAGSSPSTTISWVGSAGAATYYVSSTASSTYLSAVSSTALTGLTPNTQYSYQIRARDSFGNLAPYSAVSSSYSNAATPTAPSAAAVDSQTITVSWNGASNGTGTQYEVSNAVTGAVAATTPGTSYNVTGLSKNTSYTFRVRAQFLRNGNVYTSYATSSAATTLGTSDSGGGGGGGGGSSPAPNSTPSAVTKSFTLNTPTSLSVGGASHSVNVSKATDSGATVTIKSDPITISINKGETKNLDTDKDGVNDLRVSYQGLTESGQATLTFIPLIDLTELQEAMTINKGSYETSDKVVTVSFNTSNFTISKAVKMAVSETNDFTKLELVPFEKTKQWTLTDGLGKKTIYVRIRTSEGTTSVISDTINLIKATTDTVPDDSETVPDETDTPDEVPPVDSTPDETEVPLSTCALDIYGAYKAEGAPAVYYITNKCQKRAFTSAAKYLTYFSSWKDVQTVPASKLNSLANDSLGFMPWGPLWKPQWGAIVKHPADPKVYLLLNNEKYWITSETVFEALYSKGGWGWIEDVDPKLLDNYATGSEINYTNYHPNYTIIKYNGSSAVYRLEPDSTDSSKQVKRHIKNEAAFNKLGFRWDRIVLVQDSETYGNGADLN